MRKEKGISLVELLIALAILSFISLAGVQLLWDTLTSRSKQVSIEESSDSFRSFLITLSEQIKSAKSINVPDSSTIEITGSPCLTVRLNPATAKLEKAVDISPSCTPPQSGFVTVTQEQINVTKFELGPLGNLAPVVNITVEAVYKDGFGQHPINFVTSAKPRITL